jgi:hypothetical protein
MAPKFRGVRPKGNKYYATIRKDNVVHELGHWDTPELAARAYDAMAVEFFQEGAILNFPECREYAKFLAPPGIRICTRAEEKENKQAEMQFFDPLVSELARDEKLVETNKMMLLQYAARKSAEEDPIDWDALEREEEGQQGCRRSTRDHEAGPSSH